MGFQHLFFLMKVATVYSQRMNGAVENPIVFQHLFFLMKVATKVVKNQSE
ncbi:hypothetical protein L8106_30050 [Lyngbya sp. PCC 8106]|nr:hypothetical protein L8106_30050 [Lyngbya sp. PCC 8106]